MAVSREESPPFPLTRQPGAEGGEDVKDTKKDLLLASGTSVAGFVDDTPRHVQGALECGWNAKLMDRPWNRTSNLAKVSDLGEFAQGLPDVGRRRAPLRQP